MKAQIISLSIILVMALIFSSLGFFFHEETKKIKNYFKWLRFRK